MRKRLGVLSLFAVLSAACGGVTVTRLASEADYEEGVRFYRPQPYLLVTNFSTGERQAQVVWLPKKDEEYVLRVRSGLGDVSAQATLDQGWNLTQLGDSRKNGTADVLGAVADLGKVALSAAVAPPPKGEGLPPGLYAIEFEAKTGLVSRLRRVDFTVEEPR
jgi:hypothetical protein